MASGLLEQYEATRFLPPIRVRAGLRLWLLALLGSPFLLLSCLVAIDDGDTRYVAIGLFGLVFFGAASLVMWRAIWLSSRRGMVELSDAGLYLAHVNLLFAWADLGLAWTQTTTHRGGSTTETCFLLRRSDTYRNRGGWWTRIMFAMLRSLARSRKGGAWDWGLRGLMKLAKADKNTTGQLGEVLETMRTALRSEPGTVVLNIPAIFCGRAACEDLTTILNAEALDRAKLSARPAPASVPAWP